MQQSSVLRIISAGILATSISFIPMTLPAAAQVTTPGTGSQGTTTTSYNDKYDPGLWGLVGLVGLFGLLGRRKEDSYTTTRRNDAPGYRDPSIR
jgi:MYXO-CTERM domain-containing protein